MSTKYKSQVKNAKTRYILGVEAYSRKNKREYVFDDNTDYSNCFSIFEVTVISFFKISVYKRIRKHDVISYFLFGLKIKSLAIGEVYFKRNIKTIDIDFDDVYALHGGSGEPYIWVGYAAKVHFNKNNSKNPLIIGRRKSFEELIKMYLPDVLYITNKSLGSFDTENIYIWNILAINFILTISIKGVLTILLLMTHLCKTNIMYLDI